MPKLALLQEECFHYKNKTAENLIFRNYDKKGLDTVPFEPLQVVQIYFATSTYDRVERDERVTLEAQLGVIGGTMGLFAGFSLLSGVEIVFFVTKCFLAMIRKNKFM